MIETILISYEKGRNARFLSPIKTKVHGAWNPLLAYVHAIMYVE